MPQPESVVNSAIAAKVVPRRLPNVRLPTQAVLERRAANCERLHKLDVAEVRWDGGSIIPDGIGYVASKTKSGTPVTLVDGRFFAVSLFENGEEAGLQP
jgi:hypothetical protein